VKQVEILAVVGESRLGAPISSSPPHSADLKRLAPLHPSLLGCLELGDATFTRGPDFKFLDWSRSDALADSVR
jgi:hypothetical protein